MALPKGILSVLQTPFREDGAVDEESLVRLIDDAVAAGVNGFLAPVVASEVVYLDEGEREALVRRAVAAVAGRVPFIVGCSFPDAEICCGHAAVAEDVGADAYLVAVPANFYAQPERVLPFLREVAQSTSLPLLLQDFQLHGPGLDVDVIAALREALPALAGVKIETVPAGPKYTAVREACGEDFFVCGGWAVPQMIEALDRGVDAMIPESSMVRVYRAIWDGYAAGDRPGAVALFRRLLPVLAFSNQEVGHSIAFFKRLLVRKGILQSAHQRWPVPFDAYSERIAAELIDLYLEIEASIPSR